MRKVCRHCKKIFITDNKGTRYCNPVCYTEEQKVRNRRVCETCGKVFGSEHVHRVYVEHGKKKYKGIYCSHECRGAGRRGKSAYNWKGGMMTHFRTKEIMILIQHSNSKLGIRDKYKQRKRLVVEYLLGRELDVSECVLHLDGNPQNDHPSNLYICDIGTMRKFNNNTIEITESNLKYYDKTTNITSGEYINGKRKLATSIYGQEII
jgi:hypothetical protein